MDDVTATTIGNYFSLYATSIRLAHRVCQRHVPTANADNFTDEFAHPARSSNNERGCITKFPRYHRSGDTGQIRLFYGLGPRVGVEGAHPAGARNIFQPMRGTCKQWRKVWVDGTYRGAEWTSWVREQYNIVLESVTRAEGQKGFAVLPHRWVVERTLAWLNQNRRLSKDYEELPSTSETFVYVAMTRLMLKRLAA